MTNIRFFSFTHPTEPTDAERRHKPVAPSFGSDLNHALKEEKEFNQQKTMFFTLPPEISSEAGNVIRAVYNENYPLASNLLSWMKSAERYSALYAFSYTLENFHDFRKKTEEFCVHLEQKTALQAYAEHLRVLLSKRGEAFLPETVTSTPVSASVTSKQDTTEIPPADMLHSVFE